MQCNAGACKTVLLRFCIQVPTINACGLSRLREVVLTGREFFIPYEDRSTAIRDPSRAIEGSRVASIEFLFLRVGLEQPRTYKMSSKISRRDYRPMALSDSGQLPSRITRHDSMSKVTAPIVSVA